MCTHLDVIYKRLFLLATINRVKASETKKSVQLSYGRRPRVHAYWLNRKQRTEGCSSNQIKLQVIKFFYKKKLNCGKSLIKPKITSLEWSKLENGCSESRKNEISKKYDSWGGQQIKPQIEKMKRIKYRGIMLEM